VIKTFADGSTEELFRTGKAKTVPPDVVRRALRKLEVLHVALRLADLRVPSGNRLHALKGDRLGSTRLPSTISGAFVSASRRATPTTSSSATITNWSCFA